LISKLQNIGYYQELFQFAYGSTTITETKIQTALAQFIRSIQSFDSKYDAGRALATNDNQPFLNFTMQENQGKNLFLTPPQFDAMGSRIGGGIGCAGCHAAPEFDINPISGNNGIIGVLNGTGIDITNTRAPSLRDLVKIDGTLNGPMMHTGVFTTLQAVIGHYGTINLAPGNTNLDPKLRPNGFGQQLNLNANEVNAVMAFIKTLAGTNVYTDAKWSDPF
jgi:cytochrome c peroxidase